LSLEETLKEILRRIKDEKGGKIYCCTLNEVVMASENMEFKKILSRGDILTPDGMPLVWGMRNKGFSGAQRVYGPDLLEKFLKLSKKEKIKSLFIGDKKNQNYFLKFGEYLVVPYKDKFNKNDLDKMKKFVEKSSAKLVWVALGAEKQIYVSDNLSKKLPNKVFVTVGAAFDFLSGIKKQAPVWMRNRGLEWLFRLINEPKRLWRRYFKIGYFLLSRMSNKE
jgi:N-acetylglucosaminyldiphosphoundecaprenol N-acetyl-beta-D-mannosaminyltransferase